jgi:hypothetical protein
MVHAPSKAAGIAQEVPRIPPPFPGLSIEAEASTRSDTA